MRSICRGANHVLVWLGSDHEPEDERIYFREDIWGFSRLDRGTDKTTAMAFAMIIRIAYCEGIYSVTSTNLKEIQEDYPDESIYTLWASIRRIFNRAWFERLWVIQELDSAKPDLAMVRCENRQVPWRNLEMAVPYILDPASSSSTSRPILSASESRLLPLLDAEKFQNVALREVDRSNILTVLRQTRLVKCKDPRDR